MKRRDFITVNTACVLTGVPLLNRLLEAKSDTRGIRIGICDWSIGSRAKIDSLDKIKQINLDGVEISPSITDDDKLSYSLPDIQKEYKDKMKETGVVIASLGMTVSNKYPLATDPRGPAWLEQTIDATHNLGAKNTLIAFFGKGGLKEKGKGPDVPLNKKAVDTVVGRLKEAAPRAEKKGVFLGLENTLSAKDNMKILEAVGSDTVRVYYDIANSTRSGYDVPAEIRMLKDRINQFHFKDNKGLFNSGNPDMGPIIEAVKAINYKGWIILERSFNKKDPLAYFAKNSEFIKKELGL